MFIVYMCGCVSHFNVSLCNKAHNYRRYSCNVQIYVWVCLVYVYILQLMHCCFVLSYPITLFRPTMYEIELDGTYIYA